MVRVSAKGIVIRDRRVLLLRCRGRAGEFLAFPGGGQEVGETLADAVRREVREEVGLDVEVGRLLFVLDFLGPHADGIGGQQLELFFACSEGSVVDGDRPGGSGAPRAQIGDLPDASQVGVEWRDVTCLGDDPRVPVLPEPVALALARGDHERFDSGRYLGAWRGVPCAS